LSERIEQWTEEDGVAFAGGKEISPLSSLDELEILLGKVFARCDNTLLTETCTAG
jgi:hypothetical protein